jgi:hypothetical protein
VPGRLTTRPVLGSTLVSAAVLLIITLKLPVDPRPPATVVPRPPLTPKPTA